jgi:hypothetical protein
MKRYLAVSRLVVCCPIASAQEALCQPTLAPRAAPPEVADTAFAPALPFADATTSVLEADWLQYG